MTLPPWARRLQQAWWFHFVVAALIMAGTTMFTCFGQANEFTVACFKNGLIAGAVYLFGMLQHSPGSASFTPSGEVNQPVKQVIEMQAADIPVKVVTAK